MAITLTKRLFMTWDAPYNWSQDEANARNAYIANMVAEGKTDGKVEVTPTTIQRDFVDQASAEQFLAACVSWNPGRTMLSSSITDI